MPLAYVDNLHAHSPARVLAQYMINKQVGQIVTASTVSPQWAVFVGEVPTKPDNIICVTDTPGISDGRDHQTGDYNIYKTVQVRICGPRYNTSYQKGKMIERILETLYNESFAIEGFEYKLGAFHMITPLAFVGTQEDSRKNFTMNGKVMISKFEKEV